MMPHVLFKPYSCCAVIHPAIDAVYTLVTAHDLKAREIESIEIDYPKGSYDHSAITDPKDLLGMQFSTQYSLALTVLKRRNTPRDYSNEALTDPEVRKVASKVRLREDAQLDKLFEEGHMPARARIWTTSGRVLEQTILDAKGSPGAPSSSNEIDEKFISILNDQLAGYKNISIVRQDILRFDPSENFLRNYKIVSNLPYNITSHFLRKFLTEKNKPKTMVLLLQKEVVERICAGPGTMSLLSFSVQFFAEAKIIGSVAKENFLPQPKVDSAIVKIIPYSQEAIEEKQGTAGVDEKSIFRLVKFGFSSRRKQLHNNLASGLSSLLEKKVSNESVKEVLQELSIRPEVRAQDISMEKWLKIAFMLYKDTKFFKKTIL